MDLNLGGRSIVYPGVGVLDANGRKANRQVSNFFNTLTYAAGANVDDFGGEGAEGDGQRNKAGPLEELLTRGA